MDFLLGADGRPVSPIVPDAQRARTVEVVRSVSFKLNLGNYQSMDFFCSQKSQCQADEVSTVSADLYEWCYDQVMDSVREVKQKQADKAAAREKAA